MPEPYGLWALPLSSVSLHTKHNMWIEMPTAKIAKALLA